MAAVARAEHWTADQAARLDTTPAVILDAVRRGWILELLEKATSRYSLESLPPPLPYFPKWLEIEIEKRAKASAKAA